MRRLSATVCGLLLLTACSRGDFRPASELHVTMQAPPPLRKSRTGLVDPEALPDSGIALSDTGVRDVAGHAFVLTPSEQVRWSRRPSQWEGSDGWRADGTLFLTDDEHAYLDRIVEDLWKEAATERELASSSERSADRTWAIAMKRHGEVRVLEGHGWPVEVADAFAFVDARIYARRPVRVIQSDDGELRRHDERELRRRERSCDPVFLIDRDGHKSYKEWCL